MEYKDYYQTLGVERASTEDEIKRAYRKLARKYHPDISKDADAESKFKEVGEAFEVLGDKEKRAAYDQLGQNWQQGQDFRPPPGWDEGFEFSGARPAGGATAGEDFSDFFDQLFGGMRRQGASSRQGSGFQGSGSFRAKGQDHHARISIDLGDAIEGATRTITLRVPDVDPRGHVVLRDRTLEVKIPKGVTDGQNLRLEGQGAPGLGDAPAGDLYLEVHLRPDRLYRAVGRDLYLDLPVAPWEAALGASVRTPTPQGPVMLKVPPGSWGGRELRIRGRGMPGSQPGDLYAVLQIVLPPADTPRAKAAYDTMARELAFDPRAGMEG